MDSCILLRLVTYSFFVWRTAQIQFSVKTTSALRLYISLLSTEWYSDLLVLACRISFSLCRTVQAWYPANKKNKIPETEEMDSPETLNNISDDEVLAAEQKF